jgi:hypothetical protein
MIMMMPPPRALDVVSKDDNAAVARTSQQCLDGMAEKALSTVATVAGYDNQPERKFTACMWRTIIYTRSAPQCY